MAEHVTMTLKSKLLAESERGPETILLLYPGWTKPICIGRHFQCSLDFPKEPVGVKQEEVGIVKKRKRARNEEKLFVPNTGARETTAVLETTLLQTLLLTGQSTTALDLLKSLNYCDVKICDEILLNGNHYLCLSELYKCNSLHREALKLLHHRNIIEIDDDDDLDGECYVMKISSAKRKHVSDQIQTGESDDDLGKCISVFENEKGKSSFDKSSGEKYVILLGCASSELGLDSCWQVTSDAIVFTRMDGCGSIPINRGLIQAIRTLLPPQPIREAT
ncbi:Vam6/Vps39-like protein [Tanacetum coccineum]